MDLGASRLSFFQARAVEGHAATTAPRDPVDTNVQKKMPVVLNFSWEAMHSFQNTLQRTSKSKEEPEKKRLRPNYDNRNRAAAAESLVGHTQEADRCLWVVRKFVFLS